MPAPSSSDNSGGKRGSYDSRNAVDQVHQDSAHALEFANLPVDPVDLGQGLRLHCGTCIAALDPQFQQLRDFFQLKSQLLSSLDESDPQPPLDPIPQYTVYLGLRCQRRAV